MKIKIAIIVLAIAIVGLGIALFAIKKQAEEQQTKDAATIADLSGQVMSAKKQIDDLGQVNIVLTNDLAASRQQLAQLSNSLASAAAALNSTRSSLLSAQNQITNLNTHIADLEVQNKVLDQRAGELTNSLAQLTASIEKTQTQLAIAETNRIFIEQELQKQMAKKAELEHKFNDLDTLRAQVRKLRDEMFVARRLQLMKNDNGTKKGAELLIQRNVTFTNLPVMKPATVAAPVVTTTNKPAAVRPPAPVAKPASGYDLNVEVGSDGSVKVIPPLGATNRPAR
ncbi:MAG: hypothetical protein WCJ07_11570 [Verrucomicrobiota bacterium]